MIFGDVTEVTRYALQQQRDGGKTGATGGRRSGKRIERKRQKAARRANRSWKPGDPRSR